MSKFRWEAYVTVGKGLAKHDHEAFSRSSVSRVYYGVFNVCRRWIEKNVTAVDNYNAHATVWETFKLAERATDETRSDWVLVGNLGDTLHLLRNKADYADEVPNLKSGMQEAIQTADLIIDDLLPKLEVVPPGA